MVPIDNLESNHILPDCISTNFFVIVRPRPVPPKVLDIDPSACSNELNIPSLLSKGIPIPESIIHIIASPFFSEISTTTDPFSVNLIAFPIKLYKICSILFLSPKTSGKSAGIRF